MELVTTYGAGSHSLSPPFPKSLAETDVTLTSPVGVVQDEVGNVWLADTGNNRLLVFDPTLDHVLAQVGGRTDASVQLDLPFRLARHPTAKRLYVTDLGNERVVVLSYADGDPLSVSVETAFTAEGGIHPNGITAYEYDDGIRVFVADEFYRAEPTDLRSRIVVFDEAGEQLDSFQTVSDEGGFGRDEIPLYWPQGIDVDDEGNLLIANTGYGTLGKEDGLPEYYANVLRCDRAGEGVPFYITNSAVLDDTFQMPRSVAFVPDDHGGRIYVPDAPEGQLNVYTSRGMDRGEVPGLVDNRPAKGEVTMPRTCPEDQRRFGTPMAVAGYDPPPSLRAETDLDKGRAHVPVLLTEARTHKLSATELSLIEDTHDCFAHARGVPDSEAFGLLSGSTLREQADGQSRGWFVDAATGVAKRTESGLSTPLATQSLSENDIPIGLTVWQGGAGTYLFVTESTPSAGRGARPDQVRVYRVTDDGVHGVTSFGAYGAAPTELRIPEGVAVESLDRTTARVSVADSLNGRVSRWRFDAEAGEATHLSIVGDFGHGEDELWIPADVAVVDGTMVVADQFNNRLKLYDGEWRAVGTTGYATAGDTFCMPMSIAASGGYLFVNDLVNRAIKVFEATRDEADRVTLSFVDSQAAFGGDTTAGEFWMPYLISASHRPSAGEWDVLVPDAALNVGYHYVWDGP